MPLPSKDTDPVGHYAYRLGEAEQEIKQLREQLTAFEDGARRLRLNFVMQERDDCAALAETLGSKETAKAIRARRD